MLSNIFDAHAHYDDGWFDEDRDSVLGNLPDKGVCGVVNNSVDLDNAKRVIALAEKYDYMYAAVGVHPENLENLPDDYLDRITELTKHPKVAAVGETGLDYHWDIPREEQKRVFEEQLGLSLDLKMPIIVHDREAHGDVFDLLRKYRPNALVHCFSGSVELMREAVRMGLYISLGGVVTFKNAQNVRDAAALVPLDQMQQVGRALSAIIWSRYNQASLLNVFLERKDDILNIVAPLALAAGFYIIAILILTYSKRAK